MLCNQKSIKGRGQINYDTKCKLCGKEKEDLVHFLISCETLESGRNYQVIDGNIDNPEERMRKLVYRNNRYQEVGKQIKKLWDLRKKLLEEIPTDRNNRQKYKPSTRRSGLKDQYKPSTRRSGLKDQHKPSTRRFGLKDWYSSTTGWLGHDTRKDPPSGSQDTEYKKIYSITKTGSSTLWWDMKE